MTLHTVNKSPHSNSSLASCLRVASAEDAILLIEDGVYGALNRPGDHPLNVPPKPRVLALSEDLQARGIDTRLMEWIEIIDYDGFVELTEQNHKVIAWY